MNSAAIIPDGFCQCGCGGRTKIATTNHKPTGAIKGKPRRFIYQHHMRGPNHHSWNASGFSSGYPLTTQIGDRTYEHIRIAENALGKRLPRGAEVHHVDLNRANNSRSNLVICENRAYHLLLHVRQRAYAACGNPDWRKCNYCKRHDDPANLRFAKNRHVYHLKCQADCRRQYDNLRRLEAAS